MITLPPVMLFTMPFSPPTSTTSPTRTLYPRLLNSLILNTLTLPGSLSPNAFSGGTPISASPPTSSSLIFSSTYLLSQPLPRTIRVGPYSLPDSYTPSFLASSSFVVSTMLPVSLTLIVYSSTMKSPSLKGILGVHLYLSCFVYARHIYGVVVFIKISCLFQRMRSRVTPRLTQC